MPLRLHAGFIYLHFTDIISPKQQILTTYKLTRTGPNGSNMLSVLYIVHIGTY